MARILRICAYLFHLVLALFLLGISIVALTSSNTLNLPFLPWSGEALTQWLFWGSLVGILSILLAVTGKFRYLFPLWALFVLVMMVRGFILRPYTFDGSSEFYRILWLIAGAFVAFLASLTLFWVRPRRRA